ncbi:MAG TPA: fused response regulator/phosphatase [Bacteroidetes bacterium]|nr:fused response regulator/phosphatase [Bacteroidota bacterium]
MARVLVADDDNITRRLLQATLQKYGHDVTAVDTGDKAWDMLQDPMSPQLLILDWVMPGMDGPEIVRRLRESEMERYHYVILLTAKTQKDDVIKGLEAGADDFITKPFDKNELLFRLRAGERIIELENNLEERNWQLESTSKLLASSNERMKKDLETAARAQKSLLPSSEPDTDKVKFAWNYTPCDELAGDILNFFKLDDDHIAAYVLDVSGHGVAAALLSVTVSRFLTSDHNATSLLMQQDADSGEWKVSPPQHVARRLNEQFPLDLSTGQYFTIMYGVLDLKNMKFTYVSAGHPDLVHSPKEGEARALQSRGLPIGFDEGAEYDEYEVALQPGDRVILYSDGVVEMKNSAGEQFETARLEQTVQRYRRASLQECVEGIVTTVQEWGKELPSQDDITVLAFEMQ